VKQPSFARTGRALLAALALLATVSIAAAFSRPSGDPQVRALEIYKSFKNKDWNKLFDLSALPGVKSDNQGARKGFIDGLAGEMEKNPQSKQQFDALVNNMSDLKAGPAAVKGNKALVPTSSIVKMNGKTIPLHGRIVLVKQGADWKWDLTSGDSKQIEKASAEVFFVQPPGK
jgi:hypothetical protein